MSLPDREFEKQRWPQIISSLSLVEPRHYLQEFDKYHLELGCFLQCIHHCKNLIRCLSLEPSYPHHLSKVKRIFKLKESWIYWLLPWAHFTVKCSKFKWWNINSFILWKSHIRPSFKALFIWYFINSTTPFIPN